MADYSGSIAKAAFKKDRGLYGAGPAIAYPQTPGATDMGAGHQMPFSSEALREIVDRTDDDTLFGTGVQPPSEVTRRAAVGTLPAKLFYRGMERIIACIMGFERPLESPVFIGTGGGTKSITNATNATPIVVTAAGHGFSNGDGIHITGVLGNTAANGDWVIANKTTDTFELLHSAGNGTYTSGGTAEKMSAAAHVLEMDHNLVDQPWTTGERQSGGWSTNDRKVRRGQLGIYKGLEDWVYYSAFVSKMTISGTPRDGAMVEFEFLPYHRLRGSYNHASWTRPAGSLARILFDQCTIKLGLRSVGEATLSEAGINRFELIVDRHLNGDDQSTESNKNILIPILDERPDITLNLDFPRYSDSSFGGLGDDTIFSLLDADNEMAAKIEVAGPAIGSTGQNYKYGFYMSSMRGAESPYEAPVSGPGAIRKTMSLKAYQPGGSDIFATNNYQGVTLVKDSALVCTIHGPDMFNYLLEV